MNIVTFISRAEQLRLRGNRNYSRYMQLTKGFVEADGPERAQWQREDAQESRTDAEWNRHHGPVEGGASLLQWRHHSQATREAPHWTADDQPVSQWSRSHADDR
jgi:hypothetical protein